MQETLLAAWRGLDDFEERAVAAHVAVPDRHQPLPQRAARQRRGGRATCSTLGPPDAPEPTRWASRSGSSPTPTPCSTASPTAPTAPTSLRDQGGGRRWPSSPASSACRPTSAPCSCCATCSATAPPRWRRCSTPPRRRSTARCSGRAPRSSAARPAAPSARRCRARATERELLGRFTDAFERGDIDAVVALLTDDAWLTMPPEPLEYQGRARDRRGSCARARRRRPGSASGSSPRARTAQPAFGYYLRDAHCRSRTAAGILVLTLEGERIAAITRVPRHGVLPQFGLPRTLPTDAA